MKPIQLLALTLLLAEMVSCEKNEIGQPFNDKEGLNLVINDTLNYSSDQIDFYDISSHLIYLKEGNTFTFSNVGGFKVYIDDNEIYSGRLQPSYSSHFEIGAVIHCLPTFYSNNIIPIDFQPAPANIDTIVKDKRSDPRIISALKQHNQYRDGLTCEIVSVEKTSGNGVVLELELMNKGVDDLLFLDPEKMGLELFHYFTTGLFLSNNSGRNYAHQISVNHPDPWDSWNINWLSVIKSEEVKIISIEYSRFDAMPSGVFEASFNYPGLGFQISEDELLQAKGRIWLGDMKVKKTIELL